MLTTQKTRINFSDLFCNTLIKNPWHAFAHSSSILNVNVKSARKWWLNYPVNAGINVCGTQSQSPNVPIPLRYYASMTTLNWLPIAPGDFQCPSATDKKDHKFIILPGTHTLHQINSAMVSKIKLWIHPEKTSGLAVWGEGREEAWELSVSDVWEARGRDLSCCQRSGCVCPRVPWWWRAGWGDRRHGWSCCPPLPHSHLHNHTNDDDSIFTQTLL